MSKTIVFTHSKKYKKNVFVVLSDGKASDIMVPEEEEAILGDIYVGRVKKIVKNIGAAFVEIKEGLPCYFEPDKTKNIHYILQHSPGKLCQEDLILVQVTKEAHKTKQPSVSGDISLVSKCAVLTSGNRRMGMSSKLSVSERSKLNDLAKDYVNDEFGLIFRTNAGKATEEEIRSQIDALKAEYEEIKKYSSHKSAFTLIKKGEPDYIKALLGQYESDDVKRIVTDNKEVFEAMDEYLKANRPEYAGIIEFYDDPMISLNDKYGIDSELSKAVSPRVWLRSGAYIIFEPTEAMTVIDVNSGKYDGKKNSADTYLKINMEAADEVAAQLRLRNISGICMIDFIDMDSSMDKKKLLQHLEEVVKKDPIKTLVVDITKLGLVEITRKRMKKSLYEQLTSDN